MFNLVGCDSKLLSSRTSVAHKCPQSVQHVCSHGLADLLHPDLDLVFDLLDYWTHSKRDAEA